MTYLGYYVSPLGELTLAGDGTSLTGLWFRDQKHFGTTLDAVTQERELPVFAQARAWLDGYFLGKDPGEPPPVRLMGTAYQQQVWALLREIPYGKAVTYGELAARFPGGTSPRAVGGAVARNPVSILVPCHRVVGANGKITGYAGGTDRKEYLLNLEKQLL